MKFLGLRVDDHDSNITYTDGTKVRYCATERLFGIKHHGYNNTWQWEDVLTSWGVKVDDLDAIAIITDDVDFEEREVYRELDLGFPCKTFAIDHHYAHVLSVWPLGDVPVTNCVFDGFGNNDRSHTLFVNGKPEVVHDVNQSGSIGVSMATVGKRLGLSGDEYGLDLAGKVMGLSAYGILDQSYYDKVDMYPLSRIRDIWRYDSWHRKWDNEFDINWLRTVHEVTGDKLAKYIGGCDDVIGYTGGVAQNCVFNGKILATGQKVMIPPHANDCGLSLGAVEFLRQYYHEEKFDTKGFPFWQDDEIPEEPSEETIEKAAKHLAAGHILGWYQGAGEVGPRALGHRSILMNARNKRAKDFINSRVKHREHFRPFGAAVLREDVDKYFECDYDVPYMNVSVPVKDTELTSVTHIDGSCRIQTVDGEDVFARLLHKYKEMTGDSVLLNTSLNIGGKPIASKMWEAKEMFAKKDIDAMVIGDHLMDKY